MKRILFTLPIFFFACSGKDAQTLDAPAADAGIDVIAPDAATPEPTADWALAFDGEGTALPKTLLGEYDLSGSLFHYDQVTFLPSMMKDAGMTEWRVGLGRWEFGTRLLPTLTDGTSCAPLVSKLPPASLAPAGSTDLDLIKDRDWFTYDGKPVGPDAVNDDARYSLAYVRSVIDVATALGASPYLDLDHMPRALAANQTPARTSADWTDPCSVTWTNRVSNARPADPNVFAAAAAGLVKRVVEGSSGERGRPVRYVEMWNEPDVAYAWSPLVGTPDSYFDTAARTLVALDAYRKSSTNADARAVKFGFGAFASADVAAKVMPAFDGAGVPFDFLSFHAYDDDPLAIVAAVEKVAAAKPRASIELSLSEWGVSLGGTKLDPKTMDIALHHATVIALGANAGLTHAHHTIFWEFFPGAPADLALLGHDGEKKPAYVAFTLLASVIRDGATRITRTGGAKLDAGMGAVLASRDANGTIRVLVVNRNTTSRTLSVGAMPSKVTIFDDPTSAPRTVAPTKVVTVPARSIVVVER